VSSESTDYWTFFLSHFHYVFSIDDTKITAINNWSKDLDAALSAELSHAIHAYCCQHLCENLIKLSPDDRVHELFERLHELEARFSLKSILKQFKSYIRMQQNIWSKFHLSIG
jgi:hypothetical protein